MMLERNLLGLINLIRLTVALLFVQELNAPESICNNLEYCYLLSFIVLVLSRGELARNCNLATFGQRLATRFSGLTPDNNWEISIHAPCVRGRQPYRPIMASANGRNIT